eukprot:scaffold135247_cov31-Tisochrysis_lutea.AAC.1
MGICCCTSSPRPWGNGYRQATARTQGASHIRSAIRCCSSSSKHKFEHHTTVASFNNTAASSPAASPQTSEHLDATSAEALSSA